MKDYKTYIFINGEDVYIKRFKNDKCQASEKARNFSINNMDHSKFTAYNKVSNINGIDNLLKGIK